jgi:hypothetical protein
VPFVDQSKTGSQAYLDTLKTTLFAKMPFYEGLLLIKGSIRSAIYLDRK